MKFCRYFRTGDIATLDAGCGNGAFAYHACRLGNNVLGVNSESDQVMRCEKYRDYIGLDPIRCRFKVHNIYDLLSLGQEFDQIICFETLEHLKRDEDVLALFWQILRPEGILHICTPRADRRPYWSEALSEEENGGHVRLGYTFEMFDDLLGRHGFIVMRRDSAIGRTSLKLEEALSMVEKVILSQFPRLVGEVLHAGMFLCLYPLTLLDFVFSSRPLTIYVQARRIS